MLRDGHRISLSTRRCNHSAHGASRCTAYCCSTLLSLRLSHRLGHYTCDDCAKGTCAVRDDHAIIGAGRGIELRPTDRPHEPRREQRRHRPHISSRARRLVVGHRNVDQRTRVAVRLEPSNDAATRTLRRAGAREESVHGVAINLPILDPRHRGQWRSRHNIQRRIDRGDARQCGVEDA